MLTNGGRVSGAMLRGILPELEGQVSDVSEHMIAGSLELLAPKEYGIVLGKELAYTLGVGPGDKVTVVTPRLRVTPAGAMPRLKRFTVRGIFAMMCLNILSTTGTRSFSDFRRMPTITFIARKILKIGLLIPKATAPTLAR